MPTLYPYLISSLPMLSFGAEPPFSYGIFLNQCQGCIPDGDYAVIKKLPAAADGDGLGIPLVREWFAFDTALRNALTAARSARKHIEPGRYLRQSSTCDTSLEHLAHSALRTPLLLDAESLIDQARWNKLEELSLGHYFGRSTLIIYGFKLLILLRWKKIRAADGAGLLEEAMQGGKGRT